MLFRVTKICCARLEALQISQIWDLPAATFIIPMPVEKGQAGGGVEFFTRMMPVPLAKTPATQVVPQDVKARHANSTTTLRSVFRILRGRHRMGLLQTAFPNHAGWKFCVDSMLVRGLAQEARFFRERLLMATARSRSSRARRGNQIRFLLHHDRQYPPLS